MPIAGLLLPARCAGCGSLGSSPCAGCVARLRPAPVLDPPDGVDSFAALVRYDDLARALITAVKYRNARDPVGELAGALASLAPADLAGATVTWAPTTARRARRRGFDQAELLARAVARHLGLPARCTLRRLGAAHQTGRSALERHGGPAFVVTGRLGGPIVVVDDVCTTGATLTAAATALRDGGARGVHALALARTPARQARR